MGCVVVRYFEPPMQKKIIAKYEVDSSFAVGPLSESFKAKNHSGKGWVVIKVFTKVPHLATAELEAFKQRSKKISDLRNSSIAHICSAGKRGNGNPYVVTKFIDGTPLARLCKEGLERSEILSLFHKIAAVLESIHKSGIQHGNLKLNNVIVTGGKQTRPLLVDFSLLERKQRSTSSDSFLFAVMLYEALMGKLPFGLDTYEAIIFAEEDCLSFNELDNRYGIIVGRVFKKAFSRDRDEHYPTPSSLVKDVAKAIGIYEDMRTGKRSVVDAGSPIAVGEIAKRIIKKILGSRRSRIISAVSLLSFVAVIVAVVFIATYEEKPVYDAVVDPTDTPSFVYVSDDEAQTDNRKNESGWFSRRSPSELDIPTELSAKVIEGLTNEQILYILQAKDIDSKALALAVSEIADRGGAVFFQPLQSLAVNDSYLVRGSVAQALGHNDYLRQPATLVRLTGLLHDEEAIVRGQAAKSLKKLGTDEARKALAVRLGIEKQQVVITLINSALGLEE